MHIYIFFPQNVIQIRLHYFLDEVFLGTRSVMRQSFVPSPNVHIFHPRNTVPYRSIKPKYATQSGKLSKYLPLNVFLFPPPWKCEVHLVFSCRSVNSSEIFKALGIRVFVTYFQIVFFFKNEQLLCVFLCVILLINDAKFIEMLQTVFSFAFILSNQIFSKWDMAFTI